MRCTMYGDYFRCSCGWQGIIGGLGGAFARGNDAHADWDIYCPDCKMRLATYRENGTRQSLHNGAEVIEQKDYQI